MKVLTRHLFKLSGFYLKTVGNLNKKFKPWMRFELTISQSILTRANQFQRQTYEKKTNTFSTKRHLILEKGSHLKWLEINAMEF